MENDNARKLKVAKIALGMIRECGYLQFTMNDLSKAANVSPGTLYRTFPSKDDLLVYLFGSVVGSLRASLRMFDRMDLSEREKVICRICYQYYIRSYNTDLSSLDLIGTNAAIFNQASQETKNRFKEIFDETIQWQAANFTNLVLTGKLICSEEDLKKTIKRLIVISRGGMVIANHIFIEKEMYQIEDLMEFCDLVLDQLTWAGNEGRCDFRLILLAMRTVRDKSASGHSSQFPFAS
ncbi:regulatory protein, tetR family [Ferrimonas sediminum]|uniref:Regulatory protein, tetR family n=1 Tax=Ferrimonas sediminum TaxID=718193 RepID=A0A1G8ZTP0_9GAMM|nr:TetR/AcrR family transcriptional regulator [Ferrimonas sediminum]SDK18489.1 regulatory protein, tetR family [Ferrimonas sediminum]